jgi:hypothetical protein
MYFRYSRPEATPHNFEPKGPVISLLDDERNDLVNQMQSTLPSNDGHAGRRDIFEVPEDDSGPSRDQQISEVSAQFSILVLSKPLSYFVVKSNLYHSQLIIDLLCEHLVKISHSLAVGRHPLARNHLGSLLQPKDQKLVKEARTKTRKREN